MTTKITKIALTELAVAVAITLIALMTANGSLELMRATAAGLFLTRAAVAFARVIVANLMLLSKKHKDISMAHA
jgi:hypothetical protein